MTMTRFTLLLLGVLLFGVLVGASFFIGLSLGNNRSDEIQTDTTSSVPRLAISDSGSPLSEQQIETIRQRFPNITDEQIENLGDRLSGQMPQGDSVQAFRSGGVSGKIEGIQGRIVSLSTSQGQLEVVTNSDTRIQKLTDITLDNLESGLNITVIGSRQESGQLKASTVLVNLDGTETFQNRRRP
jgi:hypothetical protein